MGGANLTRLIPKRERSAAVARFRDGRTLAQFQITLPRHGRRFQHFGREMAYDRRQVWVVDRFGHVPV
jgi:hypothetical protein